MLLLFTLTLWCVPLLACELSVHVAQRAVRDWREGELIATEVKLGTMIDYRITLNKLEFASTITTAIGMQSLDLADSLPMILLPTANDIRAESTIRYRLGWLLDPTVVLSLVTQPTESFRLNGLQRVRTAKFWDPVCTQQTFGVGYAPPPVASPHLDWNTQLGICIKQTRAEHHTLLTDNPRTPEKERWRSEAGFQSSTTIRTRIDSLLLCQSKIEVRSLWSPTPQWTASVNTELVHYLWGIVEVRCTIQLSYDQQQSKRLQYRQGFTVGAAFKW